MAHTSGSIAQLLGAQLRGRADLPLARLDTLESAGPDTLTFIRADVFAARFAASKAGAALVTTGLEVPGFDPATRALIVVPNADLALITLLELFAPPPEKPAPGVHPTAVIDPSAVLGQGVSIGAFCVIGPRAKIGDGAVLRSHVSVEADASVGRGTVLHPNVVIGTRCTVGMGCIFYAGVVIGADGFGYRPAPDGKGVLKVPHIGRVDIGHGVEIGANSCIDRAKFGATIIGDGTKIDNHVQIGHNCVIGRACLICGVCGMAGSVTVGDGVVIGGHVGIADNLTIGARAVIAAKSGVINSVPAGQTWWGFPALPARDAARAYAVHRDLPALVQRVRAMEKALAKAAAAAK